MEYRAAVGLAKIAFMLYKLGLISRDRFGSICDRLTVKVLERDLERQKDVD